MVQKEEGLGAKKRERSRCILMWFHQWSPSVESPLVTYWEEQSDRERERERERRTLIHTVHSRHMHYTHSSTEKHTYTISTAFRDYIVTL
jgi:hypothetical protein